MFKKLFCDHNYNIIKEMEVPSELDIIKDRGYTPRTTCNVVRQYIIIYKCEKCNNIKHKKYKTAD